MLPPRYVEELKNVRDDEVDFVGTFFEVSGYDPSGKPRRNTNIRRCSRAGTRPWVAGRVCTLEWRRIN